MKCPTLISAIEQDMEAGHAAELYSGQFCINQRAGGVAVVTATNSY